MKRGRGPSASPAVDDQGKAGRDDSRPELPARVGADLPPASVRAPAIAALRDAIDRALRECGAAQVLRILVAEVEKQRRGRGRPLGSPDDAWMGLAGRVLRYRQDDAAGREGKPPRAMRDIARAILKSDGCFDPDKYKLNTKTKAVKRQFERMDELGIDAFIRHAWLLQYIHMEPDDNLREIWLRLLHKKELSAQEQSLLPVGLGGEVVLQGGVRKRSRRQKKPATHKKPPEDLKPGLVWVVARHRVHWVGLDGVPRVAKRGDRCQVPEGELQGLIQKRFVEMLPDEANS